MKPIADQATARSLKTSIPELTALRGYPLHEAAALLHQALDQSIAIQADLAEHFRSELALWRKARGLPVSTTVGVADTFKGGNRAKLFY